MVEGEGRCPQPSTNLAAGAIARERGLWPVCMADEAGSQPAGAGGELCDSQRSTAPDVRNPGWPRPVLSDERTIPRLRQKLCVDQCAQQRVADVALQPPQALRLRGGQPKARHLDELSLNPLEYFIDPHG